MLTRETIEKIAKEANCPAMENDTGKYLKDKTVMPDGWASVIFAPRNTMEVSALMKALHAEKIPVTCRGGGTGVTGAAIPFGGAVLSFENMKRIIEIDEENMTATVEAGVITKDIQDAAKLVNLFYPPDPASLENCTIGGNASVSAGGPHAVKYGTTKDYILGMEFVTADGTIMNWGGKFVKNSAGYALGPMIIGSEGTLAIITKIVLKLLPFPAYSCDILAAFTSLENAIDCVREILVARVSPCAVEFIDASAIDIVRRHSDGELPFPDAKSVLLIRLDGADKDSVTKQYESLKAVLANISYGHMLAEDEKTREHIWKCRRSIRKSIEAESPVFFAEDPVVPRSSIPAFIKCVRKNIQDMGSDCVFFGHAGDGNIHINILKFKMDDERWEKIKPEIKKSIYSEAIKYGGTITGEHGIGYLRKSFMSLAYTEQEIELMKRVKKAFDPDGILNPGKIFD